MPTLLTLLLWILAICLVAGGALLAHWLTRPNGAVVDPSLQLESWDIVADGQHNSNTDMIWWRDSFLLVHAASPYHQGTPKCRLVVRQSTDGKHWKELAVLRVPNSDIRDPKFLAIGDRLLMYALPNDTVMATPDETFVASSEDGMDWTPFQPVWPKGWLFWRPKSPDGGKTWYLPAYWHAHGESILLRSTDGIEWTKVSTIYKGDANDETAIEFFPDGRVLATCRLEMVADTWRGHPDAGTFIAVSEPPYTEWSGVKTQITRLDGPVLFWFDGRIYAVARFQPGAFGFLAKPGSVWARRRTSLWVVEEDRLIYLSDLPSQGDTSYAGVVLRDGYLYTDYYTSRIDREYPWVLGMLRRSDIRMARVPLDKLADLADRKGARRYHAPAGS